MSPLRARTSVSALLAACQMSLAGVNLHLQGRPYFFCFQNYKAVFLCDDEHHFTPYEAPIITITKFLLKTSKHNQSERYVLTNKDLMTQGECS